MPDRRPLHKAPPGLRPVRLLPAAAVELDAAELAMLLNGVALESVKRRKRYCRAG